MILVTGGGGFLGRHIVDKLLQRGEGVRVFGRRDYPDLARRGVECRRGDIADPDDVRSAAQGCSAILHTAALPGVWGTYDLYRRANYVGTGNVLDAARSLGIGKVVYTSTPSVVHGGRGIAGGDETLPYPDRYLTHYAATKAAAEQLVLAANSPALATAAIRPHLIFGPGDTQLIPKLLARAKAGQLRVIGDGRNRISVSYVENVADAHLAALDRLAPGSPVAGQVYFVNEPEPVVCWDFINRIVVGAGLPRVTASVPAGLAYAGGWLCEMLGVLTARREDPRLTRFLVSQLSTDHWFRVDKARRELGWEPRVSLDDGLARMLADITGVPPHA